jgi:hypothetical protein
VGGKSLFKLQNMDINHKEPNCGRTKIYLVQITQLKKTGKYQRKIYEVKIIDSLPQRQNI